MTDRWAKSSIRAKKGVDRPDEPASPGSGDLGPAGRQSAPSDGDVVRAVISGRTEAYELLVRRYTDVLYRHALRMTDRPDDAADIVQRAFIKGYRNLRKCRDADRVGAWLFRIAANLSKDHLKSRRRRDVSLDVVGNIPSLEANPDQATERSELKDEIQRALRQLTEEQREAFVLKHVEGWSYEEMSEKLGVSVPALKMRVHRAREELQELLERYRS